MDSDVKNVDIDPAVQTVIYYVDIDDMKLVWGADILWSGLFSCVFILYIVAARSLIRDGLRSTRNKGYMGIISVMMIITVVQTGIEYATSKATFDHPSDQYQNSDWAAKSEIVALVVWAANIVLGDVILLWRAIEVWTWSCWWAVCISGFLLCATIVMWTLEVLWTLGWAPTPIFFPIAISLLTVTWSTGLISCKAWQKRRMIRKGVNIVYYRTRFELCFALLVESGIAYGLAWTLYAVAYIVTRTNGIWTDNDLNPWQASPIVENSMTMIVVAYPMIVVALVAQEKTPLSDSLTNIEPDDEELALISRAVTPSSATEPPRARADIQAAALFSRTEQAV